MRKDIERRWSGKWSLSERWRWALTWPICTNFSVIYPRVDERSHNLVNAIKHFDRLTLANEDLRSHRELRADGILIMEAALVEG